MRKERGLHLASTRRQFKPHSALQKVTLDSGLTQASLPLGVTRNQGTFLTLVKDDHRVVSDPKFDMLA
jgi:hypothetical protein